MQNKLKDEENLVFFVYNEIKLQYKFNKNAI